MSWTASAEDLASWQPSYLAYCVARGMPPEEVRASDSEEWNGTVLGFTGWMNGQWDEFMSEKGYDQPGPSRSTSYSNGRRDVSPGSTMPRTWYAGEFHPWLWVRYGIPAASGPGT